MITTQAGAVRGAVLAILATTTLTGCSADPGASPTADAAPSASASPLGTSPSTGLAAPGEVTIDPSLPDALPLPDDIWEKTGPGWVLATYIPQYERRSGEGEVWKTWSPEVVKKVVYLVSPEGQRYQVLELEPDAGFSLESWTAGEASALVMVSDYLDVDGTYQAIFGLLDLTTGEISPLEIPFVGPQFRANLPDSVRIWTEYAEDRTYIEREGEFIPLEERWVPLSNRSQDGDWIEVRGLTEVGENVGPFRIGVARLSTGEITRFPEFEALPFCTSNGWTDAGALLVHCSTAFDDPGAYYEAAPSTGTVTASDYVRPANDGIGLAREYWLSPGVWAGSGGRFDDEQDGELEIGIEDHGMVTQLFFVDERGTPFQQPHLHTVVDGVLYLDKWSALVLAYDVATERQVVLLPGPPNAAELGTDVKASAGVSWVVAP